MLKLSIHDQRSIVNEDEFLSEIHSNLPILQQAQGFEECYADSLGWLNISEWANPDLIKQIQQIANKIRATCDAFVLIGVGGSNNTARSVIEALKNEDDAPEIIYAGNTLSAHALNRVLKRLEGKTFAINCIAKNFETLEPGSSFRILRQRLEKACPPELISERIICTGTIGSSLETLCNQENYTFLPFPTNIGGRYTAISSVALLPIAVAGLDIQAFVNGAKDMERSLRTNFSEKNLALQYATLRNLYYKKGYRLELLSSFEPQLSHFYRWWTQLFAESEGKDGKGLFPISAEYSEDLHSVGQYIQDGAPLMFETFLEIENPQDHLIISSDSKADGFDYLDGKDFCDINRAAFSATLTAHSEKLPCLILSIPSIDLYHFGQLFYFFQFSCYISGKLLGVNPFDQPGVEAYKGWMFQTLGKSK